MKLQITEINKTAEILKNGGLAIFPTETVYGLGASMCRDDAVSRIFEIKKRAKEKPLSVLIADRNQLDMAADIDDRLKDAVLENLWPGPLTIVVPKKTSVPDIITGGKNTIGVRMPANDFALELLKEVGCPLVTTSVNISGEEPARTYEEAKAFSDVVDIVIDGGVCPVGEPSTVAALEGGNIRVLREGEISADEILKVCSVYL